MTQSNPVQSLQSQQSPDLALALIAFQASVPTIHDNDKSFHGSFANLPGILSTIGPKLREHGLAVSQLPEGIDGKPGLRTTLMHVSGQSVSAVTPVEIQQGVDRKGKPLNATQEWGKAITYSRRYALQAVLGLCVGIEDNDADMELSAPPVRAETSEPAAKIEGVSDGDQPLTKDDRDKCLALISELKIDSKTKKPTPEKLASFLADFRRNFDLSEETNVAPSFTSKKHQDWMNDNMHKYV